MKSSGSPRFSAMTNSQRIAELLLEDIVERRIAPGDRLTVNELCARFNVSGAPVREALQQLGAAGYLELLPNRGAVARTFGIRELEQVFAVREALESMQAERFAAVASKEQLDVLDALADRFAEEVGNANIRRSTKLNAEFHQIINRHDNNTELLKVLERHQGISRMMRHDFGQSAARTRAAASEHKDLASAFRAHDAAAARQIAAQHVRGTLSDILDRYKEQAAKGKKA